MRQSSPVYFFCRREGLAEGKAYRTLRFNSDGRQATVTPAQARLMSFAPVLDGRADAGAIGKPILEYRAYRAPGA